MISRKNLLALSTGSPIKGLQVWGTGADCRIAGWADMAMTFIAAATRRFTIQFRCLAARLSHAS